MKISNIISTHTKDIDRNSWYGAKKIKTLDSVAMTVVGDTIIQWLDSKGWKTKLCQEYNNHGQLRRDFVSRMPNHHTKIAWYLYSSDCSDAHGNCALEYKTPHGGWRQADRNRHDDLDDLVKKALSIPQPVLITKNTLPEATIIPEHSAITIDTNTYNGEKIVRALTRLRSVTPLGVVGLETDGTISKREASTPHEEVWFHLRLISSDGREHIIITDGEKYYPIKRRGKPKVTYTIHQDLALLTTLDREMIHKAIDLIFDPEVK